MRALLDLGERKPLALDRLWANPKSPSPVPIDSRIWDLRQPSRVASLRSAVQPLTLNGGDDGIRT